MKSVKYLVLGLLGATIIVVSAVFLTESSSANGDALPETGDFRTTAVLGGKSHRQAIESFAGGEVNAFMGGVELDLRGSDMEGDEAVLDFFVMMGGVDLRVPSEWVIDNDTDVIMGGVEDYSRVPEGENMKRLVLKGTVVMGGLQIRN